MNLLKRERKPVSTSKIATIIKSNNWMAEKYLFTLEAEGCIKKINQINSVYWEIKDDK